MEKLRNRDILSNQTISSLTPPPISPLLLKTITSHAVRLRGVSEEVVEENSRFINQSDHLPRAVNCYFKCLHCHHNLAQWFAVHGDTVLIKYMKVGLVLLSMSRWSKVLNHPAWCSAEVMWRCFPPELRPGLGHSFNLKLLNLLGPHL